MSRFTVSANRFLQIMRVGGLMPLYSVSDVVGIDRATVQRRIKSGKLQVIEYKVENGPIRKYVLIQHVQRWIDERKQDVQPPSLNSIARRTRH